jgi:hypothetical protein
MENLDSYDEHCFYIILNTAIIFVSTCVAVSYFQSSAATRIG